MTLAIVGHYDYEQRDHYDGAAIGKMYSNVTALSVGLGLNLGLATLVSNSFGAGRGARENGLHLWRALALLAGPALAIAATAALFAEPLMRALSKLVNVNNPDLVLFVGEALVGNEAVDQVTGFNQSLLEYSASRAGRVIDGIMLTKFDTISDKVGAALSLVYTTGKPIVFVGVGQTYTDIRNLNVDHCVKALLRN